LTPAILGRRLTLNPVVIFISLLVWGFLWGTPGILLAVPLLATFKILCDNVEPLYPVGQFLGRREQDPAAEHGNGG
ncbi:MAG: AI-2E family transporter, partial [Geminicoccaceae bacterium]|nr:AI-2E family transporter [Geminicoccaceae bacterium]